MSAEVPGGRREALELRLRLHADARLRARVGAEGSARIGALTGGRLMDW
jgi:hypothetical protein